MPPAGESTLQEAPNLHCSEAFWPVQYFSLSLVSHSSAAALCVSSGSVLKRIYLTRDFQLGLAAVHSTARCNWYLLEAPRQWIEVVLHNQSLVVLECSAHLSAEPDVLPKDPSSKDDIPVALSCWDVARWQADVSAGCVERAPLCRTHQTVIQCGCLALQQPNKVLTSSVRAQRPCRRSRARRSCSRRCRPWRCRCLCRSRRSSCRRWRSSP